MTDRQTALRAYLEEATGRAFSWHGGDCILWAADWAVSIGRPDPAKAYRGRYKTVIGAQRLIKRHGGLEALVSSVMGPPAAGTLPPVIGDVGLVRGAAANPDDLVGAICAGGDRWAVKTARGVRVATLPVHMFWSL